MSTGLPDQFGDYTDVTRIDGGGFGVVYRARSVKLRRQVALKIPRSELLYEPGFKEQFMREAQVAAQLEHPNIVQIYQVGEWEGIPFIEMQYVDGETLKTLLGRRKRLTPQEALPIVKQVCDALEAAHAKEIVHRDLKPANILIRGDGRVLVTDFGLAKALEDGLRSVRTSEEEIVGTARYMAPEQWENGAVTKRTDVYSLGIVVYEMLTGQSPFAAKTAAGFMRAYLDKTWTPPSSVVPDLGKTIDKCLFTALRRDPEKQFATTKEFCDCFEEVVRSVSAPPELVSPQRSEPTNNGGIGALSLIVPLLSAAIWGIAVFWPSYLSESEAEFLERIVAAAFAAASLLLLPLRTWKRNLVIIAATALLAIAIIFIWQRWQSTPITVDPVPDTQPVGAVAFHGAGRPGDKIEVLVDGDYARDTTVSLTSRWSLSIPFPNPGDYKINVRSRRQDGILTDDAEPIHLRITNGFPPPSPSPSPPSSPTPTLTPEQEGDIEPVVRRYREIERDLLRTLDPKLLEELSTVATASQVETMRLEIEELAMQNQFQELEHVENTAIFTSVLEDGSHFAAVSEERTVCTHALGEGSAPPACEGPLQGFAGYVLVREADQWLVSNAVFRENE